MLSDDYYNGKISKADYYDNDRTYYDFDCDYDYEAEQQRAKELLDKGKDELETKLYEVLEKVNKSLEDEDIQKEYRYEMIQDTIKEIVEFFFDDKVEVNISTNHKKIMFEKLQGLRS